MLWFKKKKVIDLTNKEIKVPNPSSTKDVQVEEYKDLTNSGTNSSVSDNTSGLGFLSNIANASSNSDSNVDTVLETSKSSPQHLKVKIEDVEYKIDSLRNRIDKIMDRLDLTEKKIDRLER